MADFTASIIKYGDDSARVMQKTLHDNAPAINALSMTICDAIKAGGKVMFFGNGGSAADSQHFAAELVNRFLINRAELPGMALSTDTSVITSIANDFGYDLIFEKQVRALAKKSDVAIGISTSGTSKNVLLALAAAREIGCYTVGFSGANPLPMNACCDVVLAVDSLLTPIVQQVHIAMGHVTCELIEKIIFGDGGIE